MKRHRLNHHSTEKRLRMAIEKPTPVQFWGEDYVIVPRLVSRVFGNGRRLIHITPLNTRPNYYVVRVDSRWVNLDGDGFRDFIEEVYEAIEDEFGAVDYDDDESYPWPAFDGDVGVCWGGLYWPYPVKRNKENPNANC